MTNQSRYTVTDSKAVTKHNARPHNKNAGAKKELAESMINFPFNAEILYSDTYPIT